MTSEQILKDFLSRNLDLIDPNLRLIRRQYTTKYGKVDLFCEHKNGFKVAIEIKTFADTNSPGQLAKYIFAIKEQDPTIILKGLLVSEQIPQGVRDLCTHFGLDFIELKNLEIDKKDILFFNKPLSMEHINSINNKRVKHKLLKERRICLELLSNS